jgi:hypothetical protein
MSWFRARRSIYPRCAASIQRFNRCGSAWTAYSAGWGWRRWQSRRF